MIFAFIYIKCDIIWPHPILYSVGIVQRNYITFTELSEFWSKLQVVNKQFGEGLGKVCNGNEFLNSIMASNSAVEIDSER